MARFTLYSDFDCRYSAKNDTEAEALARRVHDTLTELMGSLPDAERQFTEVEARRGSRGKVVFHALTEEPDGQQR